MEKLYSFTRNSSRWLRLGLAVLLATAIATSGQAQGIGYVPSTAQNIKGNYADLGTTGTLITTANNDDALSSPQEIGFSFRFSNQTFTQFILSTNGYIKLGATAPSAASLLNALGSNNAADVNILAPSSYVDLYGAQDQAANPTSFRVSTTGNPGSRICTIQFKNLRDKASTNPVAAAQLNTIQFQIKLYEGTNIIDFVYGDWITNGSTAADQPFVVGIKGTPRSLQDYIFVYKEGDYPWNFASFEYPTSGLPPHFVRNTVLPDAGRTYRFAPAPPNDASVEAVYTLGQLPIPLATPHVVQAVISNAGSAALSNVRATLSINGANNFTNVKTIPSIPVGAAVLVSFDSYTPTNTGNSVIAVSIPDDDNTTNNGASAAQTVNRTTFAYNGVNVPADNAVGFNLQDGTASSGILLAKFTTNTPRNISAVRADLEDTRSVGRTVYAVVCNTTGTIIARSPDYVITTADLGNIKTFTLPTPVQVASGEFYVGLAQAASPAGTPGFVPLGVEDEFPTRTGAFYETTLAGGTLTDVGRAGLGRFILEAVTAPVVTANSAELKRAINLYPNPSKGSVTLAIHGVAAKAGLQVQITNLLGQTVYTNSVKADAANTLDLSSLAAGVYHLKVQNGDQYTIQKLIME